MIAENFFFVFWWKGVTRGKGLEALICLFRLGLWNTLHDAHTTMNLFNNVFLRPQRSWQTMRGCCLVVSFIFLVWHAGTGSCHPHCSEPGLLPWRWSRGGELTPGYRFSSERSVSLCPVSYCCCLSLDLGLPVWTLLLPLSFQEENLPLPQRCRYNVGFLAGNLLAQRTFLHRYIREG